MSDVVAIPETLVAAASDLAGIASTLSTANAAAAASTTGVLAAGADEVSVAITSLFSSHAQDFQALSTQAAAFHDQLVHLLNGARAHMPAPRPPTSSELCGAPPMRPPRHCWGAR